MYIPHFGRLTFSTKKQRNIITAVDKRMSYRHPSLKTANYQRMRANNVY